MIYFLLALIPMVIPFIAKYHFKHDLTIPEMILACVAPAVVIGINDIAKAQFEWVEEMGWHHATTLESLALVASEVGEAVNECRGETPTNEINQFDKNMLKLMIIKGCIAVYENSITNIDINNNAISNL